MFDTAPELVRGVRVRAVDGGPVMTVEDVFHPIFRDCCLCVWTDSDGDTRCARFAPRQLVPAPEPTGH